ncbi:MAG: ABC transporter ATP-binding protein [Methylobacteriaceae bacterium]|jgi:iron(III) transport system ATP-binding protein|nr:ABC transporter ATP-binding protein [Methylobacteriaceae bacterium]
MATITLKDIRKSYGSHTVLDGLSLTINHGECFTLLGPSGCGKTVLLRLIAGFETPDAGTIAIGDQVVTDSTTGTDLPPNDRGLGVVFQDYAVWPHMTVFDNIAYPLKLAKVPPKELKERVMEAVNQVNLTDLEQRLPSQLSGGQQQRVALARALVARPPLMLLDEPLNNLDANLREEMRFEIKELQKRLDITILYVTHDQEIGLAISDRLAIMDHHGNIRQIGTPQDIFETPADDFIFRFMGVSNFLRVSYKDNLIRVGEQNADIGIPPPSPGEWMLGCRPSEIDLAKEGPGIGGIVKRASFLGATMDYLVEVDGVPLRVIQDTHQAFDGGKLLQENQPCRIAFHAVHWFKPGADSPASNGETTP